MLGSGQLQLAFEPALGSLALRYHEHRFPLHPRSYPQVLRDDGVRGRVTVTFVVDPSGVPRLNTVTGSSGVAQLDTAALRVTRAMRFSPPLLNGVAVWARVQLPVAFERVP